MKSYASKATARVSHDRLHMLTLEAPLRLITKQSHIFGETVGRWAAARRRLDCRAASSDGRRPVVSNGYYSVSGLYDLGLRTNTGSGRAGEA